MRFDFIAVALLATSLPFVAYGADTAYPTKAIRLIVPYAPGGGNDTMARAIGAKLTQAWNQQVVIDNRPGANGLLACEITAKAAPDGYTLLMANIASHAINPSLYRKLPYDPVKDYAPVALLGTTANVLVVPPSLGVKSLQELIATAKSKGELTYGSNGTGSSQHLAGAMFGSALHLKLVHVPYKGTGPMINDLLGGQIAMSFANMVAALPMVQSKRLVPIAVTSLKREASLPDVPAVAETVPGFEATSWWGIVAPAGTPAAIVNTLNQEIIKGLHAADMGPFFARLGVEPQRMTPQQFGAFIKSEIAKWGQVVKESGARAD